MTGIAKVLLCCVLAGLAHGLVWHWLDQRIDPPDVTGRLASLSYAPATAPPARMSAGRVDKGHIDRDLAHLALVTRSIRTYTTTGGMEAVPAIAAKHGLTVTPGAWIGRDPGRNGAEIRAAIRMTGTHTNIDGLIIGNEALLRGDVSVATLTGLLRRTKALTPLPVSTAEPWHVWLQNPALANEVDFIAAHVLPYWEGLPAGQAVRYLEAIYSRLKSAFPGKRIVIAEFGWPSDGHNRGAADPGRLAQASVVRRFVAAAKRNGFDYNLVEAFDQPWKTAEGSVGPYWGLFDIERRQKFPLTGPVRTDREHEAFLAVTLGSLLCLVILIGRNRRVGQVMAVSIAANAAGAGAALIILLPVTTYMTAGEFAFWAVGLSLLIPLTAACLARFDALAQDLFGHEPRRLVRGPAIAAKGWRWPRVSIHVPACREPPALVTACLDSLARLDYPNFEVVVVVNNTLEDALWQPVEAHCRALGSRFRFLYLPHVAGYKAGALTAALDASDPQSQIIAVVDADYQVHRRWLRDLAPLFQDPGVAMVQAPQDHAEAGAAPTQRMMNCEYAGFFDIGMVHRNEENAIIAHGTMLLLRRSAVHRAGGWASDTIVEDTELGLRLLALGYRAHYTRRRYGYGVLPSGVAAYRRQRQRWAHGAMQILRKHWRLLIPWRRTLTRRQKGQFIAGWLVWQSDAAAVLLAILNLAAAPLILTGAIALPPACLIIPALAAFIVAGLHTMILYRRCVTRAPQRIAAAALCAMSLQLVVAKSIFSGLLGRRLPFRRTEKGCAESAAIRTARPKSDVRLETMLGILTAGTAIYLWAGNTHNVWEQTLFASVLGMQSLPFLAAATLNFIECVLPHRFDAVLHRWRTTRRNPVVNR